MRFEMTKFSKYRNLAAIIPQSAAMMASADKQELVDRNSASSTAGPNPFTDEFAEFVRASLKDWNVPGVSIAVVEDDKVYSEGYGFANLPDTPATPDTLWYAGSSTKAQTAGILAHLIDTKADPALCKGWSTPISSILRDDFVLQSEWATQHMTLEDAVCHRSGMSRHDTTMATVMNGKQATLLDHVRNLRNLSFTREPRTRFLYSNLPWLTLSYIIEKITGKWLGDALKEIIWTPLGMESTYFDTEDAINAPENLSTGYCWDDKTMKYSELRTSVREASGAGGIISTVRDMAKWLRCLLLESEPFSKNCHRDMKLPRTIAVPEPGIGRDILTYGLGVMRTVYKGHVLFKHGGTTEGHGCEVFWLPEVKFGVIAMANATDTSNDLGMVLAYKLIDDKLGIPEKDRCDFNTKLHENQANQKSWLSSIKAEESLFPNRAMPPLPPTLDSSKLVGSYYDPGYGKLNLREEVHPDKSDEKILVADRTDSWVHHRLRLHHVSGDYWVVYFSLLSNAAGLNIPFTAEFKFGVDGKVYGVEVRYSNPELGLDDGPVLFKRME